MPISSYFIQPLLERAVVSSHLPSLGLIDRAAEILVERLGIAPKEFDSVLCSIKRDSRALVRCKWIDEQLQVFFAEHPEGSAVELGAGLSTRFHRLSYSQEWPKFSWLIVDSCEVIDSLSRCFPSIDNFSYQESKQDDTRWLCTLLNTKRSPYIIVIENEEIVSDSRAFGRMCKAIYSELGHLHLIVDLSAEELRRLKNLIGDDLSIRNSMTMCHASKTFFNRLISFKTYSEVKKRKVCHLVLGEEPISE